MANHDRLSQNLSNGNPYDSIELAPDTLQPPFTNNKSARHTPSGSFAVNHNDVVAFVPEELDEEPTGFMLHVERVQSKINSFFSKNSRIIRIIIYLILVVGFHVFLGFALKYNFKKALPILVLTLIVWVYVIYNFVILRFFGVFLQKAATFGQANLEYAWSLILFRICTYLLVVALIVTFLVLDTSNDRKRLIGLCGMCFYIILMFLMSAHPSRINWRPVILGFLLQFVMGLLVLRWKWGGDRFNDASDLVIKFLDFTNNGTSFVYGFLAAPPNICGMDPVFAFSSIQVVVYFGSIVALLYYFGIMQAVLKRAAWLMQLTLGTTATESLNACACIFLGQSEAPLLIRPYLSKMTTSELHALMTSGFSCIAGSLFAAYIAFGACPSYLLSATVMSAPGSLACSKLLYPETEKSQLKKIEDLELPEGEENNALECISNGAISAIGIVAAILANLLVFLALLAFLDAVIEYAGDLIGFGGWSLEVILGYIFFPLAYIMGVTSNTQETLRVAQLMGTKTALNEFIAYQKLGKMVSDKLLSPKNAMIATYALCGFSNFSSIGIQLGVLGGIAPERKPLLASISFRALFAGCISCFMTASLAGILVETPINCGHAGGGSTCFDIDKYLHPNGTSSFFDESGPMAAFWNDSNVHSEL